jgi:hypothetical protein
MIARIDSLCLPATREEGRVKSKNRIDSLCLPATREEGRGDGP